MRVPLFSRFHKDIKRKTDAILGVQFLRKTSNPVRSLCQDFSGFPFRNGETESVAQGWRGWLHGSGQVGICALSNGDKELFQDPQLFSGTNSSPLFFGDCPTKNGPSPKKGSLFCQGQHLRIRPKPPTCSGSQFGGSSTWGLDFANRTKAPKTKRYQNGLP